MASKRKRSSEEERRPPGSIKADNQGSSELCVRYAIAKAVSHYLYVNEKIDIDHGHIMICLVQAMGSIDPVNPKKYDRKVIYVQDKENRRGSKPAKCPKLDGDLEGIPDKSWWEITIHVEDVTSAFKDDDSIYDEKDTYVLGYSLSKLKDSSLTGPSTDGHCVFVMKQYHRVFDKKKKLLQKVYDCLNSWGFVDPFLTIPTNHPAVMGIYKITPKARRMIPNRTSRDSSSCHGSSSGDYVYGNTNNLLYD